MPFNRHLVKTLADSFHVFSFLFQCNPYVMAAYKACLEKRSVVNFIAVDFFEKHARPVVETTLSGNREETMNPSTKTNLLTNLDWSKFFSNIPVAGRSVKN